MMQKNVQIKTDQLPEGWSLDAMDFCNQLIQRKQVNRLGYNGPNEVKAHPWLKTVRWDRIKSKQEKSPFIPPVVFSNKFGENFDKKHINKPEEPIDISAAYLRRDSIQRKAYLKQGQFQDYECDPKLVEASPTAASQYSRKTSERLNMSSTNPTLSSRT